MHKQEVQCRLQIALFRGRERFVQRGRTSALCQRLPKEDIHVICRDRSITSRLGTLLATNPKHSHSGAAGNCKSNVAVRCLGKGHYAACDHPSCCSFDLRDDRFRRLQCAPVSLVGLSSTHQRPLEQSTSTVRIKRQCVYRQRRVSVSLHRTGRLARFL